MSAQPLHVEHVDGLVVVRIGPKALSDSNILAVAAQLARLVDEEGQHNLHLDLGSMGLAKFLALHKKVRALGGHRALVNVDALVYEVFQLTRLNTVLDIRQKEQG